MQELPNARYGEQQAFQQAQAAAPMSGDIGSGGMAAGGAGGAGPDLSQLIPLDAPSMRPDQPLTAGISGGPGAGPSVANNPTPLSEDQARRLRSYLPVLVAMASQPDADPNTRQFVRQLRAALG